MSFTFCTTKEIINTINDIWLNGDLGLKGLESYSMTVYSMDFLVTLIRCFIYLFRRLVPVVPPFQFWCQIMVRQEGREEVV